MGGVSIRHSLGAFVLLGFILIGLSLMAGGCEAQAEGLKEDVVSYYEAVARDDMLGVMSFWAPDRQAEARREAEIWERKDKQGLKLDDVHVDYGPSDDQRIVHLTLSTDDKARPGKRRYETKVLLVQRFGTEWKIRDLR